MVGKFSTYIPETDESGLNASIARLDGIQEDLYNFGSYAYVLASISSGDSYKMMYVNCEESHVQEMYCSDRYNGIRPIVRLKADVRLVENNGRYDINARPIVTSATNPTLDTIVIKAIDDSGIVGYAVTKNNTPPTKFTSCNATRQLSQTVGGLTPLTTYYAWVKDTDGNISEGKVAKTAMAGVVAANPMQYYGAYVNYTDENGNPYENLELESVTGEYPAEIKWRIIYSDGEHIYITTESFVGEGNYWDVSDNVITEWNTEKSTFVNSNYAEWSKDGMTYTMFKNSYNQVRGDNPELNFVGNEEEGFIYSNNTISRLTGTQSDLYVTDESYGYYLASKFDYYYKFMYIIGGSVTERSECYMWGIRPIVCLKSDIGLVENNGKYDLMQSEEPLVTSGTSTTSSTITIKATDNKGIIGYAITEYNIEPTSFTGCASTKTLTKTVEGKTPNTTYYVWVKDTDGNVSLGKKIKTEPPQESIAADVAANPMTYYGAFVNYTDTSGVAFKAYNGTTDLQWRIFYSDGTNIYITTDGIVGKGNFGSISTVVPNLTTENDTYVNAGYAEWSKDGITFDMFKKSYNQVRGNCPAINGTGDEENGYAGASGGIYDLSGTQRFLYNMRERI